MNIDPRASERGFTVSEMAITLMIMTIVTIMIFQFLTHATDITARSESNSRAETSAQLALREVTAELRALNPATVTACAAPLPTSLNNCISFEINRNVSGLGACPKTKVSLALNSALRTIDIVRREFAAGATPGSCAGAASSTVTRIVLEKVMNNTAGASPENLFTYYGGDGSVVNPAAAGFTFTSVDSMRLLFFVEYRNTANRLEFRSVVALRNNNSR